MKGIERFRQAIKNQQDVGEAEFRLTYAEAKGLASEIEDELSRLSWAEGVPAPVDADGEVVPLTTKVMYDDCGRELKVSMFRHHVDPNATKWVAMCANNRGGNGYADVESLHLHRPDSWKWLEEDVEQFENGGTSCSYFNDEAPSCKGCKSPCRIGGNCRDAVAGDIFRRAKALAGRDAKASAPQPSPHGAKEADRD